MPNTCPFCQRLALPDLLAESPLAVAFKDAYPVSPGHALIVPKRHVADLFELTPEEQAALWQLLPEVKARLDARHGPAGYNIGVNLGAAAGQTVGHVHVHLIPRYFEDVADPRGGVRWVLPERAAYWRSNRGDQ
ncbi:MAG: HIT family protein [Anaeromyxobacteraceae bacterium]|nr:HIT family protein [Anaeromyxobacteraceae bacterium]